MTRFKEVFPFLKGMIFLAESESLLANELYDLSNVKTEVLGLGINANTSGDPKRFRENYGIKDDFILYAGRKDAGKNIDFLVECFAKYKINNPCKLKLVLLGAGEIEVPEHVRFDVIDLGFVPVMDKYDAYSASLMLCQPSVNESFSIVIMESWLCGRPVLVHESCSVTKNFTVESNGGLYFLDYADFEGCIKYFTSHKEQADMMGSQGREFVIKNYSWDIVAEKYIKYFKKVIA
jgi:glycosyltransferase involved in cell wall biosynthesis